MKMHLLPCGRLRMRKNIFIPAADRAETIELQVSSALLRHGQGNVLFDTGCHPSVPEDPEARWGGLARLMVPIMQPGEHVLADLGTAIGCRQSDLRRVQRRQRDRGDRRRDLDDDAADCRRRSTGNCRR